MKDPKNEMQNRIRRTGEETTQAIIKNLQKALLKQSLVEIRKDPEFKLAMEVVGEYLNISPKTIELQTRHVVNLVNGKIPTQKAGIVGRTNAFFLGAVAQDALTFKEKINALDTLALA